MRAARFHIGLGEIGTEQTLRHMRRLVLASAEHPSVISWAQDVVRSTPERDADAMAEAMLSWVRRNTRYTPDPTNVEVIKTPEAQLREFSSKGRITADCDDQVVLLAAGLNAVGVETEFVVAAADPNWPMDYSHVLVRYASPMRGWVSMDPIVRGTGLGWFPSRTTRVGVFDGTMLREPGRRPSLVGLAFVVVAVIYLARGRSRR